MLGYFDLDPQEVLDELARRQGYLAWLKKIIVVKSVNHSCVEYRKPKATYEQAIAMITRV